MDIYNSRNLLMKFEFDSLKILSYIYNSRNLLMKFEGEKIREYSKSTTVEIY